MGKELQRSVLGHCSCLHWVSMECLLMNWLYTAVVDTNMPFLILYFHENILPSLLQLGRKHTFLECISFSSVFFWLFWGREKALMGKETRKSCDCWSQLLLFILHSHSIMDVSKMKDLPFANKELSQNIFSSVQLFGWCSFSWSDMTLSAFFYTFLSSYVIRCSNTFTAPQQVVDCCCIHLTQMNFIQFYCSSTKQMWTPALLSPQSDTHSKKKQKNKRLWASRVVSCQNSQKQGNKCPHSPVITSTESLLLDFRLRPRFSETLPCSRSSRSSSRETKLQSVFRLAFKKIKMVI